MPLPAETDIDSAVGVLFKQSVCALDDCEVIVGLAFTEIVVDSTSEAAHVILSIV